MEAPCGAEKSAASAPFPVDVARCSDGQDLFFLGAEEFLDALDLMIRKFLDLGVGALFVVGGDQLVLGGLLHGLVTFAADVADRRLVVFDRACQ